jgi:hypothetical protein
MNYSCEIINSNQLRWPDFVTAFIESAAFVFLQAKWEECPISPPDFPLARERKREREMKNVLDCARAETIFRLSAKRTSPFKSAGRQFSRLLEAEVCASAVVMLDTPCDEVVWRVLVTHSIRQFPLHFLSRASPCAIIFQLDSIHSMFHKCAWRVDRVESLCVY